MQEKPTGSLDVIVDAHSDSVAHTELLDVELAWHYRIVPQQITKEVSVLWIDQQKDNEETKAELEFLLEGTIELKPVAGIWIEEQLRIYYPNQKVTSQTQEIQPLNQTDHDFINRMIEQARLSGSSDIHIETYEQSCRIRFRIDGGLVEKYHLDKNQYPSLINKIKILSNLDIAEKRLPQDGRIFFQSPQTGKIDLRVSTLPTLYGEKIVMRLLGNDGNQVDISALGFSAIQQEHFMESIRRPNGIILISGPTGSGKTTTLYALLKQLNRKNKNLLTIEDPIEYTLSGVNQVQVKESIGLTFASALRTFLRQDPDVVMVGEIRDIETATIAIRAALTGRLVLSTIHTNSAWGIVSRLIDMGIPPFLLASTLHMAVAQRLVRQLCPHCKTQTPLDVTLFPKHYQPPRALVSHYIATGCSICHQSGYQGRRAVYEVVPMDSDLMVSIKNKEIDVSATLSQKGISRLSDSAFRLFEEGHTSLEEIYPLLLPSAG
ncbi:GspE/PulE family protein [Cytophagaceae bacterium YF14B1]|uniref:GspE/PulE family protein n=1 Tax=Xanthocytophaga flava TaxID=3048013 RepID=A0AAE3QVB7_9BACT|nr:GspE/PulE family protein [Xanthocytophaga flavus]MDJ1486097.1 GspE/PulE family protein [Xanthocytophaga flavus]